MNVIKKILKFVMYLLFGFYVLTIVGAIFNVAKNFELYSVFMVIVEIVLISLVFLYALFGQVYRSRFLAGCFVFILGSYLYGILSNLEFYILVYGYLGLIYQIPTFYFFYKVSVAPNLKEGSKNEDI